MTGGTVDGAGRTHAGQHGWVRARAAARRIGGEGGQLKETPPEGMTGGALSRQILGGLGIVSAE
jgi:hypothetical protein